MTITFLLAAIIFAEPQADNPAPARRQNRAGQNQQWLKQLRDAYEQKDIDRIGKILDRIEKHQGQLQAGRGQGQGRMKHPQWQGNPASRSFAETRGRGQGRHWQGQGRRQWQGFAGPSKGWSQGQGRGYGRQWQGQCENCGRAFAGMTAGRRAFAQGPQAGWGHQAMQRNFARQRWGDNLERPQVRGGFGQGPVKRFGPGKNAPMRQQRQKARSEWDW